VRLQEQGVSVEDAYAQCLADQGQEFVGAIENTKASGALVSYNNLAKFAALSQKGFTREPRELLVLAKWRDNVTAFLVSCGQLR
jgi:hypothetical protein